MKQFLRTAVLAVILAFAQAALAVADVSRVEIASRRDVSGGRQFGAAGAYERLDGTLYFLVDPAYKGNRVIVDLDKAQRNAAGKIEMSTELVIFRPRDPKRGNGIALFDIVNRGSTAALRRFNLPTAGGDDSGDGIGDGFLLNRGYTIIQVGWEFDVRGGDDAVRMDPPRAAGMAGLVHATFVPPSPKPFTVTDLSGYTPSDPASLENILTVREMSQGAPQRVPREKWSLSGNVVTVEGGFEPGRIYEVGYKAVDPPIAALGFAAVRDAASWVKYTPGTPVTARYTLAFGSSQTGRFLREFLYQGFNTDEHNRQVFDAVIPHTSGTGDLKLNRRWSIPTSLSNYTAMFFPFTDRKQRDPVTGAEEGILENPRTAAHQPKTIWTNTGTEYWQKAAALTHTTPDGLTDLALPPNVRSYFLAGAQHGGRGRFPTTVTNGEQRDNPTSYIWTLRALMVGMEKWLLEGVAPPPSRYPRWQDSTLVRAADVAFPALPGVTSPRKAMTESRGANVFLPKDGGAGTPLPFVVPQVDRDGNEISGVRLPELVVPLATTSGWNFRKASTGGSHLMVPLLGSYIPFAATKAERERTSDPRLSIEERYQSRDHYLKLVREAAAPLVKDGYLLADDVPAIVQQASEHWDSLAQRSSSGTTPGTRAGR